jgi:hypothetical protein
MESALIEIVFFKKKTSNRMMHWMIGLTEYIWNVIKETSIFKAKGSLDNDYLDNFDNEFLNKYEKNLKNKKFYEYVIILID